MSRYIDVDALGIGRANPDVFIREEYASGWNLAIEIIENAPTADVVEVVRCKDCKHFDKNKAYRDTQFSFSFCDKFHHNIITENDFCSYGARMDGGDKE